MRSCVQCCTRVVTAESAEVVCGCLGVSVQAGPAALAAAQGIVRCGGHIASWVNCTMCALRLLCG
jgi:hypothetical protein